MRASAVVPIPDVMQLPVAVEVFDLRTREAAERAAGFLAWMQERVEFAVPNDALLADVRAEAQRRGIDCNPHFARQWREAPDRYWALVVDPGFPVEPLLWEGDDS